MFSVHMLIITGLMYTKDSKLIKAMISTKRGHDYAFSSVDIVL